MITLVVAILFNDDPTRHVDLREIASIRIKAIPPNTETLAPVDAASFDRRTANQRPMIATNAADVAACTADIERVSFSRRDLPIDVRYSLEFVDVAGASKTIHASRWGDAWIDGEAWSADEKRWIERCWATLKLPNRLRPQGTPVVHSPTLHPPTGTETMWILGCTILAFLTLCWLLFRAIRNRRRLRSSSRRNGS